MTEQTDKLLPPMFAKGGANNKSNKDLPEQSRPKLTKAEAVAVQKYTGSAFSDLNDRLRTGQKLSKNQEKLNDDLAEAFSKTQPFATPVTVHRGL